MITALPFLLAASAVPSTQAEPTRPAARATIMATARIIAAEKISFDETSDTRQPVIRSDRQLRKSSNKRLVEFF